MKHLSYFILSFMILIIGGCSDSGNPVTTEPPAVDDCGVTDGDNSSCVNYSTEIQRIFDANCTFCHGGAGGLVLDSYSNLMANDVIISGNSAESKLIQKLKGTASGEQMPKGLEALDESIITLIETWINEGALNN